MAKYKRVFSQTVDDLASPQNYHSTYGPRILLAVAQRSPTETASYFLFFLFLVVKELVKHMAAEVQKIDNEPMSCFE